MYIGRPNVTTSCPARKLLSVAVAGRTYPLGDFVHLDVEEVEVLVEVLVFEETLADHLRRETTALASAGLTAGTPKPHDATGGAALGAGGGWGREAGLHGVMSTPFHLQSS